MKLKRILVSLLAVVSLTAAGAACGDDPGEDRIGDGEINDEGD